ncbi:MAG TPA: hypothetical protein PLX18_11400 [Anaerohalosphaeraceae bacterium]|nr:hypothetical protein [Anaerohalosphaeraceae bacterium]HQG06860.1 hypothetical protein [Anaerohalosphaeraceae bacterium]HQI08447.1 hypothetical protein [Anaerohalosphaeraceae bacterium]HQJ68766.1 hypothetical protein [Anaerohalosphaeraceae bacterium]
MIKSELIRQTRRLLLRSLDRVYPSPITVKGLFQVLCSVDDSYGIDLLRKDLAYLQEKGYIRILNLDGPASLADVQLDSLTVVKLTAAGLEIAQNLQKDSAIEP